MALDPATRLSGWPHWVTIPPKLESAFYSAGKYSVGTNGVLRKLKHIFPNTYQRINMMIYFNDNGAPVLSEDIFTGPPK